MKTIKILICGGIQENFMNQLTSGIKQFSNSKYSFDILYKDKINEKLYKNIDHFINASIKTSFFKKISVFFVLLFTRNTFFELFLDFKVRNLRKIVIPFIFFKERIKAKIFADFLAKKNYDILHFQYLYKELYLQYLPKTQKIVCSIWGSDLYRRSGLSMTYYQSKILNRATRISIHSIEMREVLLAKFGRHLAEKVFIALFPPYENLFKQIKENQSNTGLTNRFKEKYHINRNKIVVAIGHNAKEENRHIKVVHEIAKLNKSIKSKIVCIFQLTYGSYNKEKYAQKINNICKENNIEAITFLEYLTTKELAALRLVSDILIHTPVTDAMSGFATEAMYAGNLLITGAWLPYGTFKRAGLKYMEIENIKEISSLLSNIVSNGIDKYKLNIRQQQKAIEQTFFPEPTSKMWIRLYNEVLNIEKN